MLVALSGNATAGKDTAALGLIAAGWHRLAFADVLKELAWRIGWSGRKDEVGRKFLEDLGREARNVLGENVWIDPVRREIERLLAEGENVVITDLRYPNEAHAVLALGGYTVRVERPGVGPGGPSDTELPKVGWVFHGTLCNDDTPGKVQRDLLDLIDRFNASC